MAAPTYTALTTAAKVKERVSITGTASDALLSTLVTSISKEIEDNLGRFLGQQTHTEYYDGDGTSRIYLRYGPLVAVSSVNHVSYYDSGGSRAETLTAVAEADRLEGGTLDEGHLGRGWIDIPHSTFLRGTRNYKIKYQFGWATIPEDVSQVALDLIVAAYKSREVTGLQNFTIGESTIVPWTPAQRAKYIKSQLSHYVLHTEMSF